MRVRVTIAALGMVGAIAACSAGVPDDHEFDSGSRVTVTAPTPLQIRSLVMLGKVWGFLKYHHPAVVGGEHQWDYELFRVLRAVLAASDRDSAKAALTRWVDGLGRAEACRDCAETPLGRPVVPHFDWLLDRELLGDELSERLQTLYTDRPNVTQQYYAGFATRGAGNPDFANEPEYAKDGVPDAGFRLLALYRLWNIIEYWFPYRDLIDEDWDRVLAEFVPKVLGATTRDGYELVMTELIARIDDGHANLWSSVALRPPPGSARLPIAVRFLGGRAVVAGFPIAELGAATGLRLGDVLMAFDGTPIDTLVARWRPWYPASNEAARLRDIARALPRGLPGRVRVKVMRAGRTIEIDTQRVPVAGLQPERTHDHAGETFRRLSDDLAYLKLSSVKASESADYVRGAASAKCLLIDIRNYPGEFVVFALGQHLVPKRTEFATFTYGDPANPGSFRWTPAVYLEPAAPRFEGRVAILVDEITQSQAEYTTMAFRTAPRAIVVGSTTSGADGNFSTIMLPGGLRTGISGIGVFYPDQRPTQQVGILPDVFVEPTPEGIRAGRDEVLEAAVRSVLGRAMTEAERAALK